VAFIDTVLQAPSYGWMDEKGELIVPTTKQLWREAFHRVNLFRDKRNWISAINWIMMICMLPFLFFFVTTYFTIPLLLVFLFYTMIVMGTHGTIWFHRYCTHHSYSFRAKFWRFFTQNLVIKTFPEEIYVISHHVHHSKSDEPGDPYNPKGGLLYCMLSYINHQNISKNLSETQYSKAANFLQHTGIKVNSFEAYKKWGSVATPLYTTSLWLGNWLLWYGILYLVGGHALVCAVFSAAFFWCLLVPAFNYTGHGKGQVKHSDGIDFDRSNLSINQWRPGYFAGEWHNNHHLYPGSARCGFLSWQLDLPWIYIYTLYKLGAVRRLRDSKGDFIKKYGTLLKVKNKQEDH
jgi:stearoyl-CoA desaturase (delta-9 desaturase)